MQGSNQGRARLVKVGNTNRLTWIKRTGEDDGENVFFSFLFFSFVPVTPIA